MEAIHLQHQNSPLTTETIAKTITTTLSEITHLLKDLIRDHPTLTNSQLLSQIINQNYQNNKKR